MVVVCFCGLILLCFSDKRYVSFLFDALKVRNQKEKPFFYASFVLDSVFFSYELSQS